MCVAAAGVQALVSRLLIAQVGGTVPVQGALLMHEHWCLWSSLGRGDAAALVRLASLTLLPAAHAAEQPSLGSRISSTLRSVIQFKLPIPQIACDWHTLQNACNF